MWLSRACKEGLVDTDVILVVFFCWSGFLFLRDGFESVIKSRTRKKASKGSKRMLGLQSYQGLSESQPRENRNEWGGVIARTPARCSFLSISLLLVATDKCWSLNDGWDYFGWCSRLLRERKRNIRHMRQKSILCLLSFFFFADCHVLTLFFIQS